MSALITHTHSHSLLLPAVPSMGTLVTRALLQPVPGRFQPCLQAFPDTLRAPLQFPPGQLRAPLPAAMAPRPGRARRGGSGQAETLPGGNPRGMWRGDSSQLTRAVAAAHLAGEQEGACEQTGSVGRGAAPRPPGRARRCPRYPPRSRAESHMAAGGAAQSRAQESGDSGRVTVQCPARCPLLRRAAQPTAAAAPALNPRRAHEHWGGREGRRARGWAAPPLGPAGAARPPPARPPPASSAGSGGPALPPEQSGVVIRLPAR